MATRQTRIYPKSLALPGLTRSSPGIASPTFGGGSPSPLEGVPEESIEDVVTQRTEVPLPTKATTVRNFESVSGIQSKTRECLSFIERTIIDLFSSTNEKMVLTHGELALLHENVRFILASKVGSFIFEYFKDQFLPRGMTILRERLMQYREEKLLQNLVNTWGLFFKGVLPILDAIFYIVKTKPGRLNIRQTSLVAFRDLVLLKLDVEGIMIRANENKRLHPDLKHMLLILQMVNDSYPPNKQKIRLEYLVARIVVPFWGFKGIYFGGSEPAVKSEEPAIAERRRSCEQAFGRRVSRPLTVQPKQMETLNQLFLTALRKQEAS